MNLLITKYQKGAGTSKYRCMWFAFNSKEYLFDRRIEEFEDTVEWHIKDILSDSMGYYREIKDLSVLRTV